ncbi:helix-turn-helix domain-containing protein [Sphingomonas sp. 1P08PE]|uniref:helix-turn-helix domain-containing protein n=1 Tax=Sphingomonas sp. 1P08PE TaxID=554122 RepID=UPI0039A2BAA6
MERTSSIAASAKALGIGRTKLYELLKANRLASIRIGRRRLILADSIDALIADTLVEEGR